MINSLTLASAMIFFGSDIKSKGNKSKNKHVGIHQTKKIFGTAKETINKMKRQLIEWEKIFANRISDKGFISKIDKKKIHVSQ